jgi:hypothetical protein
VVQDQKEPAIMTARPHLLAPDHKEAVRLSWKSRHIPFGTILVLTLLLAGIFSAASMMWMS